MEDLWLPGLPPYGYVPADFYLRHRLISLAAALQMTNYCAKQLMHDIESMKLGLILQEAARHHHHERYNNIIQQTLELLWHVRYKR